MRELIVCYSFSGNTRKYAETLSRLRGAELCEIKEKKKRGIFGAFFRGCPQAVRGKRVPIQPLSVRFEDFDKITLAAPVWAGSHAPALNSAVDLLPEGKQVELILISGQGSGYGDKLAAMVKAQRCTVTGVINVKTGEEPNV